MADATTAIVRAAQEGDTVAAGLLLSRHYAGMLAVATRMLGSRPDAEDACQDSAITACARIGELRDPAAVRGWLHAIVRNKCRTMLCAREPVPVGVAGQGRLASELDDPGACIERSAQRDWIWHGMRQLTPAVQPVAMLRYFTEANSYEQIAALCGIPVGTVRSRLSEARRQLAAILPATLDAPHGDTAALVTERREEAIQILSTDSNGTRLSQVTGRWADDLVMYWPNGTRSTGLDLLSRALCSDYDDGVTYRLTGVKAGVGLTIWENEFVNPPEDPGHCPPAATWLLREKEGRISEVRLFHAPRPATG